LKQAGDEVGMLALLDSWPSLVNVDLDDDARFLCELANFFGRFYGSGVKLDYQDLSKLGRDAQLEHVLAQARELGVVSALLDSESVGRFLNLCKANLRIMMHNELVPCDLPVHFFRAATGDLINEKIRQDAGHDYGWGELVGPSLVVQEVPGDHVTMLTGDNAAHLARLLRACMAAQPV
jgi:thioesterase domain-containing protein